MKEGVRRRTVSTLNADVRETSRGPLQRGLKRSSTHCRVDISLTERGSAAEEVWIPDAVAGEDDLARLLQRVVQLGRDVERCEDRLVVRGEVLQREEQVKAMVQQLGRRDRPSRARCEGGVSQSVGSTAEECWVSRTHKPSRAPTNSPKAQAARRVPSACLIDCLPRATVVRCSTSAGAK